MKKHNLVSRLELTNITKQYPGCLANDNVSLTLMPGEIHALLGENGAGKSTLVKTIYGVVAPDKGDIIWNGKEVSIKSPSVARDLGIGMVFQHFSLFETLTVSQNIELCLSKAQLNEIGDLEERITKLSEEYGLNVKPSRYVHSLSIGERQRVEIIRCLVQSVKLLILDEPTSVLTPKKYQAYLTFYVDFLMKVAAFCLSATNFMKSQKFAIKPPFYEAVKSLIPAYHKMKHRPLSQK